MQTVTERTPNGAAPAAGRRSWLGISRGGLRLAAAAVVICLVLAATNAGLSWYSKVLILADRTAQTAPVEVTISQTRLKVPANLIRFSGQRAGGQMARLDLALLWPAMTGYSQTSARQFDDTSAKAPLVFLTIAPKRLETDTTGRLASIYSHFFTGAAQSQHGLTMRAMRDGIGYENELVAFEAGATDPFVARCYANTGASTPDTCLREIHIFGNLAVTYRFRRSLLTDWRQLDHGIRNVIIGLSSG